MKKLYLLLSLFLPLNGAIAQSITVGPVSKLLACVGDSIRIPYTSSGTFQEDNFFTVQLSDASGSFSSFTNIGHSSSTAGSIAIAITYAGNHFRVRVISTDPYIISSDTSEDIQILDIPTPNPTPKLASTYFFGPTSFIGDTVSLADFALEYIESTDLWKFDQDANTLWSTNASPSVYYNSAGTKTGTLTVTTRAGCSTTKPFSLTILTCNPVIPDSAHIVTGSESGSFPFVWVKTGANYTNLSQDVIATIFVEAGASLQTVFRSAGLYYIKPNASFVPNNDQGEAVAILSRGNSLSFDPYRGGVDTLYCDDLQFDYSKVGGSADVKAPEDPLQIEILPNSLRVSRSEENISISVVNLFGTKILSKTDKGTISLDLTTLANGVYFAIITSGDLQEVRKISVIH